MNCDDITIAGCALHNQPVYTEPFIVPVRMDTTDFNQQLLLLQRLKDKDPDAFVQLSNDYSEDLLLLAYTIVRNSEQSTLAVEYLFAQLWEGDHFNDVTPPLHHFLYKELKRCCRHIQDDAWGRS